MRYIVEISIVAQSRSALHRKSVVLCCDAKYLPYAALTIDTLLRSNPRPDFDICVVSLDPLVLPEVLRRDEVRFCQIAVGDVFDGLRTTDRFSLAAYVRLALPAAFVEDYDRILYLDCDIMVVGTAISEVFDIDLGDAPIGAVSDNMKWKYPGKPTPDQAGLGVNGPYFNSGVLLIDCQAFLAQGVLDACLRVAAENNPEKIHFDQTLLNLALVGNWAGLHPVWNWQWAAVRPMLEVYVDVQILHFVGIAKPWSAHAKGMPLRYRALAYRFLKAHFPALDVPLPTRQFDKWSVIATLVHHIGKVPVFAQLMAHYGSDIMSVKRPK
ncbi:glycosyltransferase family 8 protein [Yoonia sp. MH D7]